MNSILLLILFLLMFFVGGRRGIRSFFSICLNFLVLLETFYFIALGFNAIIVALINCFLISYIILFFINGDNVKTRSSIKAVFIVLIFLVSMIFLITFFSRIGGFGYESFEEINMYSYDVAIDFSKISVALILIGVIGATVDTSIAISSALYEVYLNNTHLSRKELFNSGINIGKDILGTTVNTLLFAFFSEFLTLLIWFKMSDYSFLDIINAKTFAAEFIKIMFSAIGCISIIPITSYISSKNIKKLPKV